MSKFSMRLAAVIAASTVSVAGAGFAAPALAQTTSEAGAEATPGAAADADRACQVVCVWGLIS